MELAAGEGVIQSERKWQASPVMCYKGPLDQVRKHIPTFERKTFGPALLPAKDFDVENPFATPYPPGFNRFHDVIVRQPINSQEVEVPVGIVSKQYTLIQHQDLVDTALHAVQKARIDPSEIITQLDLTEYGERMRLGLIFPKKYNMVLPNNDEMGLRLECFNSVDGSMKFMSVIGWLRFVCANGLIIGVADSYYKKRHNRYMELSDIAAILQGGIAATTTEREMILSWQKRKLSEAGFAKWTDSVLAKRWGVKAAVRAWHITRTGHDVAQEDPFEKGRPTEKHVIQIMKVPGAVLPGDNVYALSQSLSWLAKERRDVQEQLEWKQQIPDLLAPLCA
jgi:hypothetical protein